MGNPFTDAAKGKPKPKTKLKAFGGVSKPAPTKPVSAPVAPKRKRRKKEKAPLKLKGFGGLDRYAAEKDRIRGQLTELSKEYQLAVKAEKKAFKPLDTLELKGKTDNMKYVKLKKEWDAAWKEVERINNRMLGLVGRLSALDKR